MEVGEWVKAEDERHYRLGNARAEILNGAFCIVDFGSEDIDTCHRTLIAATKVPDGPGPITLAIDEQNQGFLLELMRADVAMLLRQTGRARNVVQVRSIASPLTAELNCWQISTFWFRSPNDSRWDAVPEGVALKGYVCARSMPDALALIAEYCPGVEVDEDETFLWTEGWPVDSEITETKQRSLWIEFADYVEAESGETVREFNDRATRVL